MKTQQLKLFNIPSSRELLFKRLGFDPKIYEDKIDIKKGLPGQSENTLIGFFPKLGVGISLPNNETLQIKRRNLPPNIYEIDFHILRNEEPVAYIDNEQRQAYLFEHPKAPVNIPLDSFKGNMEQWQEKRLSTKVTYYKKFPTVSFHIARSPDMNKGICCWANDFICLKPVLWKTKMGPIRVWQVPRDKTCFGYINEPTIEDWILLKLEKEGLLN